MGGFALTLTVTFAQHAPTHVKLRKHPNNQRAIEKAFTHTPRQVKNSSQVLTREATAQLFVGRRGDAARQSRQADARRAAVVLVAGAAEADEARSCRLRCTGGASVGTVVQLYKVRIEFLFFNFFLLVHTPNVTMVRCCRGHAHLYIIREFERPESRRRTARQRIRGISNDKLTRRELRSTYSSVEVERSVRSSHSSERARRSPDPRIRQVIRLSRRKLHSLVGA